ncbi:hypothetical protein [Spiroplasma alleghenense]|uniref:Uncharacterized protein n=1 Tax=Spiroplasma alleghenense TaxID=216931 RepID=A0A345Z4H8_9MOLU|nr:hypothetical protein [Spiroplasma alleghenense]AXK51507.1 hypothetical protein SALLE_v1c08370 [Spiroplasma alleghenense]
MLLAQELSKLTSNLLIGFSFLAVLLAIGFVFIYKRWLRKRKVEKADFTTESGRYKIFSFWQNYFFIFMIFLCVVAGIFMFAMGISFYIPNK